MKPAFYFGSAVLAAAVAVHAEEVAQVLQEVESAQVDPVSSNVWDSRALEWVSLDEYRARVLQRSSPPEFLQVPKVQPVITNGLQILTDRQEAIRRHWERVNYLQDTYLNPSLRF
jgi:hypothetical protein